MMSLKLATYVLKRDNKTLCMQHIINPQKNLVGRWKMKRGKPTYLIGVFKTLFTSEL